MPCMNVNVCSKKCRRIAGLRCQGTYLCSVLEPQTLHGIQPLQRRPASAEHESKDEDERDDGFRLGWPLCHFFGLDRIVPQVGSIQRRDEGEDDHDDRDRDEQLRTSPPFVCEAGAEDRTTERYDVLHAIQEELGVVVGNARALEHLWVIVGDWAISGPLANDASA